MPGLILAQNSERFQRGSVIDKIVCKADSSQSYALYLPGEYSPQKKWPILFAFDPGGRGDIPLKHFKDAAEKYNYLVIGPNNAKNGPWEPIIRAMLAVYSDAQLRFSIDKTRIFVTGFSGGSRAASLFSQVIQKPVVGIIGCGAGIATHLKPGEIESSAYCGIVGIMDFNYREMERLESQFEKQDIIHRILIFPGRHTWPPPEICTLAIEWMELVVMKQKIKPLDEELIERLFLKEIAEAQELEESIDFASALTRYEAVVRIFGEWQNIEEIQIKIRNLKENRLYRQFLKNEKKREREETTILNKFNREIARIENHPPNRATLHKILPMLKIKTLSKAANDNENIYDKSMAVRTLHNIHVIARNEAYVQYEKGDFKRAILFFEVAIRAGVGIFGDQPYEYFNLACAYARDKNSDKALESLRLAIQEGFNERELLESDKDLEFIRKTPEFISLLDALRKR
jgi:tetratricopeptide (TPR) repeat protein